MSILTRTFWTAALERAIKTAFQALALAGIGDGFDVLQADWRVLLGAFLGGFVTSVVTSLASNGVGDAQGPSLANEYAVNVRDGLDGPRRASRPFTE